MKYEINETYLLRVLEELIRTPSPTGYDVLLRPVLERLAAEQGFSVSYDHKRTAYVTLEGRDNSKTVLVGAHADTIGLMIRSVDADGTLKFRVIGGVNTNSLEGDSVTVLTRGGKRFTGLIICRSHSTHVFDDAITLPRNEETLRILLDENVHTKEEVRALGIGPGDYASMDPKFVCTEKGYIKSRYLDDKAAVACCFELLRYLRETGSKPRYRTVLAFPYLEEVGLGGSWIPPEVSEYVAMDIGLIGPELDGSEDKVSICAKDTFTPYDFELTNRLIACAERAGCGYAVDVYFRYGSDSVAAQEGGSNAAAALFGMAVYCSHGVERTHRTGLRQTVGLLLEYVLGGE